MVEREKVVVVLLLITIILSVVSAVLTLTLNVPQSVEQRSSVQASQISNLDELANANQNGEVSLGIEAPTTG